MPKRVLEDGTVLFTFYDCPPIPLRGYDWSCIDDNYEGEGSNSVIGYGSTEKEAIRDWQEQDSERGL